MSALFEQLDFFNPLKVELQTFEGPLELLLELVRKKKMELHEIPLAEICEPYLEYLELMEEFDMEIAVEFLDIASTLILIKSRALLPKPPPELEEEEGLDPEERLRQKLIEYQLYKTAGSDLESRNQLGREFFTRPDLPDFEEKESKVVFQDVSLYSLVQAYQRVLKKRGFHKAHEIEKEELPIERTILSFMHQLLPGEMITFDSLLPKTPPKAVVVVSFMAILELAKLLLVRLHQLEEFGTLHIEAQPHISEQIPFYEELWRRAS